MNLMRVVLEAIEHGWVHLAVQDAQGEADLWLENVPTDPLALLLDSALNLAAGRETHALFHNGPDITPFHVGLAEGEQCTMELGDRQFHATREQYVRAVVRAFDRFTYAHGEQSYVDHWGELPKGRLNMARIWIQSVKV